MVIDQNRLRQMFVGAAEALEAESTYLSEIDSKFGDGDHGVTIGRIAHLMKTSVDGWKEGTSIHDFMETLGEDIMGINGGSAGPLYGTMVGGMAIPLEGEGEIDGPLLKKVLGSMRSEMEDITTATIGDKTMMDALIPAVEAGCRAEDDVKVILETAAAAAEAGAKASENFVSKFGRAKSYKEQTIGTPDAGAVSTSVFFRGLANGFIKE